jgi:hypothetical protein
MALSVAAAVLLVAGLSAQGKKDFTGKWVVDTEKSGGNQANAGGGNQRGGGGMASPFEIRMDAKTMVVVTNRNNVESTAKYNLDGSDSKNQGSTRGGQAGEQVSNAKWDGDKLVIVNKTTNQTTTYWMDGANLVRESNSGREGATPTRTYFKKQS